jgi:hypothetical protein
MHNATWRLCVLVLLAMVLAATFRASYPFRHAQPFVVPIQASGFLAGRNECPRSAERPIVLLVTGQSNAANHAAERHAAHHPRVLALTPSGCVALTDPIPGGSGRGGSIWPKLADSLADDTGRPVVIAMVAQESTRASQWADPWGPLVNRVRRVAAQMRQLGLQPSAVLWMQGEADALARTRPSDYRRSLALWFAQVEDSAGPVPLWIAGVSRCRSMPNPIVRRMQAAAVTEAGRVRREGPDLDLLGDDYRRDGCHFSERGQDAAADAWFQILRRSLKE